MTKLQLLVQDDFIEEFLKTLPSDKVKVIDQTFMDAQTDFQSELESFQKDPEAFLPYHEQMKKIDQWINEGAQQ